MVLLLGALAAQCLSAMRVKSATYDEPFYLSAGYAYLTHGRFELNREHPPLMKYLIGLPLLFQDLRPLEEFEDWRIVPDKRMAFGAWFLFENSADPDAMLFWSRIPVLVLSLATGVLVWLWARALYGDLAAVMALLLYCLCPNIVAHSSLATLDLGVTAGVFASSFALWSWSRKPSAGWTVTAGAALAAALLMKFSAIVLLGLMPLAYFTAMRHQAVTPLKDKPGHSRRNDKGTRAGRLMPVSFGRTAVACAAIVVAAGLMIAIAYGPARFGIADYVRGFELGVLRREALTTEGYESFCWGRYSSTGFWYYHFAAFLIKTPLPALLLGIAGMALWFRRPRATGPSGARSVFSLDALFLLVPIALTFLITMPIQKNFGLRNVLPVYPFFHVLAGGAAAWLWRWRAGRVAVPLLAAWSIVSAVRIHPDQLSYFNELIGGPARGIHYLDDSNIDWGQDLKRLAAYVRERGITDLKLYYFAGYFLKPAAKHYGLEYTRMRIPEDVERPQPGWYAVSAHLLQRPKLLRNSDVRFDWLDRFTPEEVIGHSIYVYHFE